MVALQKFTGSEMSAGTSYGSCSKVADEGRGVEGAIDQFPAGLRVLVVDDDRTCLRALEMMLQKCLYQVTTCCQAKVALTLLRERKGGFDLVISDVHMPDMDGFKLLEHVGLEMDLPVIMMSADGQTSAVMKGIKHGACDYLIKPVRMEELKNIWQHVVRKKWNDKKEHENSGSLDESDWQKRGIDDADYASSVNDVADVNWKKKKRESKEDEDEGELDNDDLSASKKPRVVWSVELHQQFVSAVNQLGIDKAVPKRILELMNVPGLTRENVASHLQKFRLFLKRLSGVAQHQGGLPSSYCGAIETNHKVNPLGRLDFQALAASGQLPPQTLAAALHAELLGRPSGNMVLSGLEQPSLLQTSLPGPKLILVDHGLEFSPPLVKSSNIANQCTQNNIILEDISSGFSEWSANKIGAACPTSNLAGLNSLQNNNTLDQMLPHKQSQPVVSDSIHQVNQPSCLGIPSPSSTTYHLGSTSSPINPNSLLVSSQTANSYQVSNAPVPINQNTSFSNCETVVDYHPFPSQPSSASFCVGLANGHFKGSGLLNGCSVAGSLSSPMSSSLVSLDGYSGWKASNSVMNTSLSGRLSGISPKFGIHSAVMSTVPDQVQIKNLGFVGKGTSIPSRFAVDDVESPTGSLNQNNVIISNTANAVKQEIHLDFMEGSKGGNPVSYYSPGDCMSIISK